MTNLKPVLFILCFCGMVLPVVAGQLPEPVLVGDDVPKPTFGDERSVALLGSLLAEKDVRVRERAALELGQTHNPAALPKLKQAAGDSAPIVRAAAVCGAAELGPAGNEIVLAGLKDKDDAPLQAAMRSAGALQLVEAVDSLRALSGHERETIRYSALQTLTSLHQPAGVDNLKRLMNDPSVAVRVEALQNALLLKDGKELKGEFSRLVKESQPAVVRAAAVECLGTFVLNPQPPVPASQPASQPTSAPLASESLPASALAPVQEKTKDKPWTQIEDYAKVARAKNPLLRRAVVRVYRRHGLSEDILPFLADPSAMVRLSAAVALEDLPNPNALGPLVKLFLNTPDDDTHQAARTALQNIGGSPVGEAMAENLPKIIADLQTNESARENLQKKIETLTKQKDTKKQSKLDAEIAADRMKSDALSRQGMQWQRNAMSCCYLLGVLQRKEGLDELFRLATSLPLDSPILGETADALARIGDPAAIMSLQQALDRCAKRARPYLKAMTSMSVPPPFSEKNTGKVIQALVKLGDRDSTDKILGLTKISVMSMRLGTVIAYVLEIAPSLKTEENQKQIEIFILGSLIDTNLNTLVQWRAAKLSGTLKYKRALPTLKNILNEQRKCTSLMTVAAWAIQKITGSENPPKIPNPERNEGDWIIKQVD